MKIVKRFYIFVFLIAIFLRASFPVFGDENTQNFQQLIDDYVQAVHSNDAQQIKTTWSALNQDEAAKAYMRENMPGVEYLFNIRGLYFELQDYQSSRPEYFGKKPTDSDFQGTLDTLKEDLSGSAVGKVEDFSLSPKERKARTNRDIVLDSKAVPRIDNQTIALSNPNQNRIDNKTLINSRTDSFYLSKFQKAPDELVPLGSNFPKTRPPSQADAVVKDVASRLLFKNNSVTDQVVDVYVNDVLVGSNITVSSQGRTFVVYFSPGLNRLRIVGHQFEPKFMSLGISLPDASYTKDAGEWSVRSGQDRQWSVELKSEF